MMPVDFLGYVTAKCGNLLNPRTSMNFSPLRDCVSTLSGDMAELKDQYTRDPMLTLGYLLIFNKSLPTIACND
jgi:hypothetical protein